MPSLDFGTLLPLISCHTHLFLVTLSSLTLLAILSTAAPQAPLSNCVNSGNSGFNSKVSQAGGDTSVDTVLIKFL